MLIWQVVFIRKIWQILTHRRFNKKRSMTSLNSSSSFPLTAHVWHQYKVRALPNLRSPTASPPTVTEPLLLFSSLLFSPGSSLWISVSPSSLGNGKLDYKSTFPSLDFHDVSASGSSSVCVRRLFQLLVFVRGLDARYARFIVWSRRWFHRISQIWNPPR